MVPCLHRGLEHPFWTSLNCCKLPQNQTFYCEKPPSNDHQQCLWPETDALTTRNDISTCDLVDISVDSLNNMVRDVFFSQYEKKWAAVSLQISVFPFSRSGVSELPKQRANLLFIRLWGWGGPWPVGVENASASVGMNNTKSLVLMGGNKAPLLVLMGRMMPSMVSVGGMVSHHCCQ